MTHNSSKLVRLLLGFIVLSGCFLVCASQVQAQNTPDATAKPKVTTPKPVTKGHKYVRPKPEVTNSSEELSLLDQFLVLADGFYEKGKLNAAEVAYKEALRISPRNPDAVYGLGYIYVTKGQEHDAQGQLNKLRSLDAELAGELAGAINKAKTGN